MLKTLVVVNLGRCSEDQGGDRVAQDGDERELGTGVAVTLRGRVHVMTNMLLEDR